MRKPYYIIYIILLVFLTACGSNQHPSSDTGSISFKLQLSHPTTMSRTAAATSVNICMDYGITHINARVVNLSGVEVAAEYWSCEDHEGIIQNVPAGADYTIRITGTVTGIPNAWSGEKRGVGVTAGVETPTGLITMTYIGNDNTPPDISATNPIKDATGVPVTNTITARFSEMMAASSINDSTFKLNSGATPVSGSVVYDNGRRSADLRPSSILLSYSTTYTATLTADIEDMAGKKMESAYEWRFTTEDLPSPGTKPEAPSGLIAASGNSQVKVSWDAEPAATFYNIYWSDTSGVTKTVGTKISGITTTSYTHTNLANGTNYFYVVTSGNNYGESIESIEIASAPGSIDTNLPTASVIINDEAVFTTSTDVTLLLLSSSTRGISRMCISNTNTTTCSSWEPYTSSRAWILPAGDGFKTVFALFEESTGSRTGTDVDDISLDTTPPANGTLTVTAGDGHFSLSWSGFSDATSGIGGYKLVYSTNGIPDSCSSGTQVYSGIDTSYIHSGLTNGATYYYRVCAVDNAGNVSVGVF